MPMEPAEYEHPVLGRVYWRASLGWWEAKLDLAPGCPVAFAISPAGEWAELEPAELFERGAEFLGWAGEFEPRCRERIAADLAGLHRTALPDDEREPPAPHSGPQSPPLRLKAVVLHHPGNSSWVYDCGDAFGGRGIGVLVRADRSILGDAYLVG